MKRRNLLITGAVLAVAVIGFVAIAPSADDAAGDQYRWLARDPVVREAERLWGEALDAQQRAEGEWELAHSIALASQAAPSRAPFTFVAQRDLPPSVARAYEEIARREFAALGADTRLPVTVFVVMDSLRTRTWTRRVVVVPQRTADPCVVVVRIEVRRGALNAPNPRAEVLGICSYYAKFGSPGTGMQAWLDRTRARSAAGWVPEPRTDRQPRQLTESDVIMLPVVAACVAGRPNTCSRIFEAENVDLLPSRRMTEWRLTDPNSHVVANTNGPRAWSFGPWEVRSRTGHQLASLRTAIGDERFAAIWLSADDPATAFQRSEGYPIDDFVRRQLAQEVLPYRPGPMVHGLPLLVALFLTAGFAAWALARSGRVMS